MVKPVKFTRDSGCPAAGDEFLVINVVHIPRGVPGVSSDADDRMGANIKT